MRSSPVSTALISTAITIMAVTMLAACTASAGAPVAASTTAGTVNHQLPPSRPGDIPPRGTEAAGGDDQPGQYGDPDEHVIPPAHAVVVGIQQVAGTGVLVDANGFTLYTFSADTPLSSHCTGACAVRWRPAYSAGGKPQAGPGASAADIGSILRTDGAYQVTYFGAPLYLFAADTRAGDRNGSGLTEFGGRFSCAPPAGTATN
jgi:predicted lipoprotein with Yx(FWY)xxD motif